MYFRAEIGYVGQARGVFGAGELMEDEEARTPTSELHAALVQARLGRVRGLGAQMPICGDFPRVHRKVAATQIAGFERRSCSLPRGPCALVT